MSIYSIISGYIYYKTKPAFHDAENFLKENNWVNQSGSFVDELYNPISFVGTDVFEDQLLIKIPYANHRNLLGVLDKLLKGSDSNYIVCTCLDGDFIGETCTNSVWTEYDLEDWSENYECGCMEPPEDDEDTDGYEGWKREVEGNFLEEFNA